ncbi:MAG: tRNA dihydrouridine synthase DusB [Planctomycetes bacterium]|nr:tRNA dihydrouridine synthase DusB [Planctomycetota bacterium]
MKLKLGDTELASNLLTSPLCGISNRPFRLLAKRFGSGLSYVEMLKARTVVDRHPKAMALLKYYADEKPLGAQFASSEPNDLAEACKIAEDMGFDTIDLNSGCPAGRVGKELCGARLMSRPDVASKLMSAMKNAVKIPVTVKIRAGMDDTALNFLEFGRIAQEEGMNWITMHPRTRAQGYKGDADHRRTAELKAHVKIPVIASGDVKEPKDALAITDKLGIDGVMIGRGIYGKPWLYRRIIAAQQGHNESETPPPREVLHVLRWHFEGLMEVFEARTACILQRRYSGWYIKGIRGAPAWRARFVKIETPEAFYDNWNQCDAELAAMESRGEIEPTDPERLIWNRGSMISQGLTQDDLFSAEEKASAPSGREVITA